MIMLAIGGINVGGFYGLAAKVIKGLSMPETEARNLGMLWSIYAVTGSALGAIGAYFIATMEGFSGWKPLMFCFGGVAFFVMIMGFLFLKEEKLNDWSVLAKSKEEASKFEFKHLGKVLLMPELWVAGLIYHTMLMITAAGIEAVNMMGQVYLVPVVIVSLIGTFRAYMARCFLSPLSGYMAGKTGDSMKIIRLLLIVGLVAIGIFFLFPTSPEYMWVGIVLVLAMTFGFGMQAPLWMTPITEIRVPQAYQGTAVGVYNALGSASDSYIYIVIGILKGNNIIENINGVDTVTGTAGYQQIFMLIAGVLIVCFIATLVLNKMIKKRNAMLDAQAANS